MLMFENSCETLASEGNLRCFFFLLLYKESGGARLGGAGSGALLMENIIEMNSIPPEERGSNTEERRNERAPNSEDGRERSAKNSKPNNSIYYTDFDGCLSFVMPSIRHNWCRRNKSCERTRVVTSARRSNSFK